MSIKSVQSNISNRTLEKSYPDVPCKETVLDPNNYSNTTIYNHDEKSDDIYNDDLYTIIIINLMVKIFPTIVKPEMTLKEIFKEVLDKTGYLILEIKKINNDSNKIMYEARRKASCLGDTDKIVFHGTNEHNAEKICKEGFLLQNIKRALFGFGIYVSLCFFLALYYAQPNEDDHKQTVVIGDSLQGPTAIGTEGQTEFGKDANNKPIMTLTDNLGKINCFKYPEQINVQYIITVQCQTIKNQDNNKDILSQVNHVKYYHPDIWKIIKNNKYVIAANNARVAAQVAQVV